MRRGGRGGGCDGCTAGGAATGFLLWRRGVPAGMSHAVAGGMMRMMRTTNCGMVGAAALLLSASAFAADPATGISDGSCTPAVADGAASLSSSLAAIARATASDESLIAGATACAKPQSRVGGKSIARTSGGALTFLSGLEVDADGAPNAYAPGNRGLDALANAGRPGHWYGIVTVHGRPVVQGPHDPFPGFYVSPTSLENPALPATDPHRYVDATAIPFLALPPELLGRNGVKLGDVAAVEYGGRVVYAIVADRGPRGKLGEGSVALAKALGIPSSPRTGGLERHAIRVVLLPGTGNGRPMSTPDIDAKARAALANACSAQAPVPLPRPRPSNLP